MGGGISTCLKERGVVGGDGEGGLEGGDGVMVRGFHR